MRERGKGEEVYRDESGDDIGGGEELHGSVDVACIAQERCLVFVLGPVRHKFPRAK